MTTKHGMKRKRKLRTPWLKKLDFEPALEFERAHRTGRAWRQDGTPKLRTVVSSIGHGGIRTFCIFWV